MSCVNVVLLFTLALISGSEPDCPAKKHTVLAVSDCKVLDTVPKVDWEACAHFCSIWQVCDIWEFAKGQCKMHGFKDHGPRCMLEATQDDIIGGMKSCTREVADEDEIITEAPREPSDGEENDGEQSDGEENDGEQSDGGL